MPRSAVAKNVCVVVAVNVHYEITDLVVQRSDIAEPLIPACGDFLRRKVFRLASRKRGHVERYLIGKTFFHHEPVALIGLEEKLIDRINQLLAFDKCFQ